MMITRITRIDDDRSTFNFKQTLTTHRSTLREEEVDTIFRDDGRQLRPTRRRYRRRQEYLGRHRRFQFLLFSALIGSYVILGLSMGAPPRYSVAIAGASGLDVDDGGNATFNPVFNVTVRVTSRSKDRACLHPATRPCGPGLLPRRPRAPGARPLRRRGSTRTARPWRGGRCGGRAGVLDCWTASPRT
jgi:hypothetical protein